MFVAELLTALAISLLVVVLFTAVLGRPGPWSRTGAVSGGVLWFFLVVFLGAWAVGIWADPVGPVLYGVSWVPFLFGALVLGLLLAALSEPRPRPAVAAGAEDPEAEAAVGIFFWLLILTLFIPILFGAF